MFKNWFPLLLVFLAAALLSSCATGAGGSAVAKASPPASVTVAVKQFDSPNYAALSSADRGVRDFEAIFLPLRLVDALQGVSGVSRAYFSADDTAATDFVVSGSVLESDGRTLRLKLELRRVDGARIKSKVYTLQHDDGRDAIVAAKLTLFLKVAAADLMAPVKKTSISLPHARMRAYAENPALPVTEKRLADSDAAGDIERSDVLAPLTQAMLPRSKIMEKSYVAWQGVSTPLVRERQVAKSRQTTANITQALALAGGALSVASSYQAAQAGNVAQMQAANQTLSQANTVMVQGAANAAIAENRVKQLTAALAAFKNEFAVGQQRQVTVHIYGKLIKLTGSQRDMLNQFRSVVKEQLNKS
jgi:hypothetical protein